MTRSQTQAADIQALLRARNALIYVVTREEMRVEGYLAEASAAAGYTPHTWDVAQGVCSIDGRIESRDSVGDVSVLFDLIRSKSTRAREQGERDVWIMRDMHSILVPGPMGAMPTRQMRNLARSLPDAARECGQAMIVVTPDPNIPQELAGHAIFIDWPMPDRDEIAMILDAVLKSGGDKIETPTNGVREAALDAAIGMNGIEARACYARSLVNLKRIDPVLIANEKKRIIAKDKVLEWHDPLPGGLDDVGGLDLLKRWLISHTAAYSPDARAYGLPLPKGVLLVGVPGCGKTYTAKAFATALACPLVRLDLNALKGKFVGQSEQNLRTAIRVIEALGRVVVWIDEIEKSLQGATSDSADGGVSSDALGTMLSWMQERTSGAFVIATANDVSKLPPELLRKGRFDEIFFVDAPNATERLDVLKAALRSHKRPADCVDAPAQVVKATEGFTGSEIANLVPEAMFAAYSDGKRQINTDDLIEAARNVVPLTTTAKEKVAALRAWAKERARPATSIESVTRKTRGAALDIDA